MRTVLLEGLFFSIFASSSVGPYMGNLKDGLALRWETKMAPGGRDRGVVYVTVFDWLS